MAYRTPGVYVEEISLFPPSVAEVKTAVPAFIGYTEKATRRGRDLTNIPTKLRSLLEFRDRFGGEYPITTIDLVVNAENNYAVVPEKTVVNDRYYMFEALKLFFDNGGGECYIVSVGSYGDDIALATLKGGVAALSKYDEPTMILFPDAVLLEDESQFAGLQQAALSQCSKLQDRVAIFDLKENHPANGNGVARDHIESVQGFRNTVGINNLKYGAAYTPWLYTSYEKEVDYAAFKDSVKDTGDSAVNLATLSSNTALNELVTNLETAMADSAVLAGLITTAIDDADFTSLSGKYVSLATALRATDPATDAHQGALTDMVEFVRGLANRFDNWRGVFDKEKGTLNNDLETYAKDTVGPAVAELIRFEKNEDVRDRTGLANAAAAEAEYSDLTATGWIAADADITMDATNYGGNDKDTSLLIEKALRKIFDQLNAFVDDMSEAAATHQEIAQTTLYRDHPTIGAMVEHMEGELGRVPPSGVMAGVYARVDAARGVWKAPANVSLNFVRKPTVPIDFFDQEDLNVDVVAGKSINAIRTFTGKGTMVWGARTLAGNDNEWRYVPVRRFFNMVEESVKKSTGWAVFEPNDAKLWTKVKSMIDNYLLQKWREGALQGAAPEDAFFVKVGLGQTMIAQDILEGRLIVEIGMAVVRPAEFIILRFMHKMPVS